MLTEKAEILHALLGIFHAPATLRKLDQNSNFVRIHRASLYLLGESQHRIHGVIVQGVNHRQCQLALGHVVTRGFSYLLGVVIIEDIIANLEHNTQILPELPGLYHFLLGSTSREGTNGSTGLEEGGRLLLDHLVIHLLGNLLILDIGELQDFARSERATQLGQVFYDALITRFRNVQQGR